ncbi:MAG: Fur family transcriptional regulator [Dehalococcoidales bacterium]|jgi:Fe2+ or Zn2+ uptake regulation protein|nr:Fur family transcriptional regulator [Dehalococcoidales bacterium]MDX9985851.1 Fur family transcriptional regulator [Dehalococcoidales bacterium]
MVYSYKDVLAELKHEGYKITPQRRAIIQILEATENHMTPHEIHKKVNNHLGISLVTIYRTLDTLEKAGLICRLNTESGHVGYLLRRPRSHHHHLICSICGLVVNIGDCGLEELEKHISKHTGFIINSHTLDMSGICPECHKNNCTKSGGNFW